MKKKNHIVNKIEQSFSVKQLKKKILLNYILRTASILVTTTCEKSGSGI